MTIVGNDIVDFSQDHCIGKGQNERYLKKALTEVERLFVSRASNPDLALWICWSIKESAYKVALKQGMKPSFNPRLLATQWGVEKGHVEGEVKTPTGTVFVRGIFNEQVIYTTACSDNDVFSQIHQEHFRIEDVSYVSQSQEVRSRMAIAMKGKFPNSSVSFGKNKLGIPYVAGFNRKVDISFTHCNHWGAYAFFYD